jgi:predicted nucleic-acid-binding protein
MRSIDTNVLVRLIVRDDGRQAERAEAFIANGAWVSHLVLAETCWVLESVYGLRAAQIATAIDMLLNHAQLAMQDRDIATTALASLRRQPAVSFSDNLILAIARTNGHVPLGTFDRPLGRLEGVQRL